MLELGDTLLDRYRLERVLGGGGMGRIFTAQDLRTGKPCAVKEATLPDDPGDEAVARGMFKRELKSLTLLDDPGIVRLLDYGNLDAGVPFIVMEQLDGSDLSTLKRAAPEAVVVAVALKTLRALDRVHLAGIVHRDLKPSNVFLCRSGRVVLLDFGVARGGVSTGSTLARSYRTQIIGTAAFMAPEHIQGAPMQPKSDVYSLGGTLFALAAGRNPFLGSASRTVMEAILCDERPALDELCPGFQPATVALIEAMLDFDPEARPDAAHALALAEAAAKALVGIEDALVRFAAEALPAPSRAPRPALANASAESRQGEATQVVTTPLTTPITAPLTAASTATRQRRDRSLGRKIALAAAAAGIATAALLSALTLRDDPTPAPVASVPADALQLPDPTTPQPIAVPAPAAPERVSPPPLLPKPDDQARAPKKGTLLVTLDRWAEVFIDGKSVGEREGSTKLSLSTGRHELSFKNPKYPVKSVSVDVVAGSNTPLRVELGR